MAWLLIVWIQAGVWAIPITVSGIGYEEQCHTLAAKIREQYKGMVSKNHKCISYDPGTRSPT